MRMEWKVDEMEWCDVCREKREVHKFDFEKAYSQWVGVWVGRVYFHFSSIGDR